MACINIWVGTFSHALLEHENVHSNISMFIYFHCSCFSVINFHKSNDFVPLQIFKSNLSSQEYRNICVISLLNHPGHSISTVHYIPVKKSKCTEQLASGPIGLILLRPVHEITKCIIEKVQMTMEACRKKIVQLNIQKHKCTFNKYSILDLFNGFYVGQANRIYLHVYF